MVLNTTNGPAAVPRGIGERVINTSEVLEPPQMQYVDEPEEPEILSVLPATGWSALVGGVTVPLVVWVAEDTGRLYGVVPGEDGRIDLVEGDVEQRDGFTGYVNNNDSEEK